MTTSTKRRTRARRRPWTPADDERLEELVGKVERTIDVTGAAAVKDVILQAAKVESVQELADAMGVHRPALSNCLAAKGTQHELRRALEKRLRLPPGGMWKLLAFIETEDRKE